MNGKINLREGQVWQDAMEKQYTVVSRSGMRATLKDSEGNVTKVKYTKMKRVLSLVG